MIFFNVSVSLGEVSAGVTAYAVSNLAPNIPWKLFVYKDLQVKKYRVEYDYLEQGESNKSIGLRLRDFT